MASLIAVTNPSSVSTTTVPNGIFNVSSTTPGIVKIISSQFASFGEVKEEEVKEDLTKPTKDVIEKLIASKAIKADLNPSLVRKIAFCESTMRQFDDTGTVLRGVHNPADVGLFQINEKYHLERSKKLGFDIYAVEGNIDYAIHLIEKEGTRHWYWSQNCWGGEVA